MSNTTKIILGVLSLGMLAMSSCNTMQGAGQDLSRGGAAISNAAADAKH